MRNIFENANFGDKFVTRDGRMAIYHSYNNIYPGNPYETHHNLILKERDKESDSLWVFVNDYGHANEHIEGYWLNETCTDIVGRWQEPIDEDELDRLARNYEKQLEYYEYLPEDIEEAYKAGYRRAKEE